MSLLAAAGRGGRRSPPSRARRPPGLRDFRQLIAELRKLAGRAARRGDPPGARPQRLPRRCCSDSDDDEDQERLANIEELITAAKQFARRGQQPDHRRLPGEHHAGQRRRRLGRGAGLRLGHDAARRQGAGIPRRVHARRWSRALLPHERSLSQGRGAGGGTPARLRRHDAGQGGAVPVPRPAARVPRQHAVRDAEHVPRRTARGGGANGGRLRRQCAGRGRLARRRTVGGPQAGSTPASSRARFPTRSHQPPRTAAVTLPACWSATICTAPAGSRT